MKKCKCGTTKGGVRIVTCDSCAEKLPPKKESGTWGTAIPSKLSLCPECNCMTKKFNNVCGKCKHIPPVLDDHIEEKLREISKFLSCNEGELVIEVGKLFIEVKAKELEFLRRIELEVDCNICECGEEWKNTDIDNLIKERIEELS